MRRRAFLATLAAAATCAVLDPEKLLWVPGRTSYFDLGATSLPTDGWTGGLGLKPGDIFTIAGVYDVNPRGDGLRLQEFVVIGGVDDRTVHVERFIPAIEPPILDPRRVGKPYAKPIATWRPPVKRSRQERRR